MRQDRIGLLRFVGGAAQTAATARPASSRSPASLILSSPLIMPATSSGLATLPRAEMARRRTLASSLATSSSKAGTAADGTAVVEDLDVERAAASVLGLLERVDERLVHAVGEDGLQAVPGGAGKVAAVLDRLDQKRHGRAVTHSAERGQRSGLHAPDRCWPPRPRRRARPRGRGERPGAPSRATWAAGGKSARPSASCLMPLLSSSATKPTTTDESSASPRAST